MKMDAGAITRTVGKGNWYLMKPASDSRGGGGTNTLTVLLNGVTAREAEVVGLVAQGLTNKEIASELHVSARTIQTHMERIFKKLGVRFRAELVAQVYATMMPKGNGERDKFGRLRFRIISVKWRASEWDGTQRIVRNIAPSGLSQWIVTTSVPRKEGIQYFMRATRNRQ